jgi:hypothetical protein
MSPTRKIALSNHYPPQPYSFSPFKDINEGAQILFATIEAYYEPIQSNTYLAYYKPLHM